MVGKNAAGDEREKVDNTLLGAISETVMQDRYSKLTETIEK